MRIIQQDGGQPLLAVESNKLISALPVMLYLLHCPPHYKGEEVNVHLGAKRLLKCLRVLRANPVQTLIGVMPLCTTTLLCASPALCSQGKALYGYCHGSVSLVHSSHIVSSLPLFPTHRHPWQF